MSDRLFVGQRPVDVLVVWPDPLPSRVIACEGGSDADAVAARLGCPVDTLERRGGRRSAWSNATVGRASALVRAGELDPGATLMPYAAAVELDRLASRTDSVLLAAPPESKAKLDDKLATRRALLARGVPVPEFEAVTAREASFARLRRRLGVPFVIQRLVGSAGVGTWIVGDDYSLGRLPVAPTEPLVASRYIDGTVVNVHGVVTESHVYVAPASVQAAGVSGLAVAEAGYCGNDFGLARALVPPHVARRETLAVGDWLHERGWRGVFGVDLLIGDGARADVLEVNPRFQGSSWLLGTLEAAAGRVGIGTVHVSAFDDAARPPTYSGASLDGSFAVLHHLGRAPLVARRSLEPGAYLVDDGQLVHVGDALSPADRPDADVVLGALPDPGTVVVPGAVLVRVSSLRSLFAGSSTLSDLGLAAVGAVRARLADPAELTPA